MRSYCHPRPVKYRFYEIGKWVISPCRGKSKNATIGLLPFQGEHRAIHHPRALPWAKSTLPLRDAGGTIADNHNIFVVYVGKETK